MKMLAGLLFLVLTTVGYASTDVETFLYDGSRDSVQMSLNAEQTHTEYRYENRWTTCYRTETYYRTVCQNTPQGRFCQTVPYSRTVAYSCMRTVSIPYEVKDFDVVANVTLDVVKKSELPASETFKLSLKGDSLTLSAVGSKKFFILKKKQQVNTRQNGSVKFIEAAYTAELVEAADALSALQMTNISLRNNVLNFSIGKLSAPEQIGFHLKVKKAPVLGSDTTIFNRELAGSEILLNAEETSTTANVDIEKLGVKFKSGRHTLTAKAFYRHAGSLLNASQFENLEASKTLIYKAK